MQQSTASSSAPTTSSFASLLAALALPKEKSGRFADGSSSPGPDSVWNLDALEDDIATLSYERALRTHSRYRPSSPTDDSLTQAAGPGPYRLQGPLGDESEPTRQPATSPTATPKSALKLSPEPKHFPATPFEQNLKDASITIRMSKSECEQLRMRAAEAGLSVSAYLRSCTFEAESLRAMVKDTLAQLRTATTSKEPASPPPPKNSWFQTTASWFARLFTPWQAKQHLARA